MKSLVLFICGMMVFHLLCAQNYSLNGDAEAVGTNCIAVTPNQAWQNGSVWYTDLLDLTQPFTLEFQMNYGTVDANGADGMMFVLQNIGPNALGEDGAGLGFQGFNPAFGIEFDTYYNSDFADIPADHVAFQRNGNTNHSWTNNLAGPVSAHPFGQNIEDGQEHPIKITWNPISRVVQLFFDCVLRLSAQVDLVNSIFNGNSQVWWGFTGATGGLSNAQLVCLAETYEFNDNLEFTICQGESVQISANGNPDGNYLWEPAVGLSDSLLQSPVASPITSTEYCYTYTDVCSNVTTGCIQVNVETAPVVSAGDDDFYCEGDQYTLQGSCDQPGAGIQWTDQSGIIVSNGSNLNPSVNVAGTYTLTATSSIGQCSSSDEVVIIETPLPAPTFGSVLTKCAYDSVILDVGNIWQSVNWFDGSMESILVAYSAGIYEVTIQENDCELEFIFEVQDITPPDIDLGDDQFFCDGETVLIDAAMVVSWSTGLIDAVLPATTTGDYSAEIEWLGCFNRDTIHVESIPNPIVDAGEDDVFCAGSEYPFSGSTDQTDILFQWTLPNGIQTNFSEDPSLFAQLPGTYSLSVINELTSCMGSDVVELEEIPLPVPNFDLLVEKCSYDVAILDVGETWDTVLWSDGSTENTTIAEEEGVYPVIIEILNCSTTVDIQVQNVAPPEINLGEDLFFCEGETVYIDASIIVLWNTGLTDAILPVTASGEYSAEVELLGCYNRDTIYIESIPVPIVEAADDGVFCEGSEYPISGSADQADVLYQWTLPNGDQTNFSANSSLLADLPGVYTLTAVNQLTSCTGSDAVELEEIPLPVPNFDLLIEKCSYDHAVLDVGNSWDAVLWSDGSTENTFVAEEQGNYPVIIEESNCAITVDIQVQDIVPPAVNLGLDREICLGDNALLSAGFPVEWQDGSVASNHLAVAEGEYYALSYLQGCFVSDTVNVNITSPISLGLTSDTLLCEGSSMILRSNYSGVWSTGDIDNAILVDQPGIFTILVNQGPCLVQDSVHVAMQLLPSVIITDYEKYCDGESYQLQAIAEHGDYYVWSTGDTTSSILVSESMMVSVETGNACGRSMNSIDVLFEDCSSMIYMPTSFTPNGDGINDEFWPVISNVKSYELTIYDRWGRPVFNSRDYSDPWLGNISEGDYFVPNGQYNYHLRCTTEAGNAIERRGYILVIR